MIEKTTGACWLATVKVYLKELTTLSAPHQYYLTNFYSGRHYNPSHYTYRRIEELLGMKDILARGSSSVMLTLQIFESCARSPRLKKPETKKRGAWRMYGSKSQPPVLPQTFCGLTAISTGTRAGLVKVLLRRLIGSNLLAASGFTGSRSGSTASTCDGKCDVKQQLLE
ncbi:hypothetical protein FOL47_006971 [Perkinsus chesapeaki]|uniref:Uncharacterized protein n=1 Tax=Perkinsus chesapeaki TaxID=330153 RepID=A0A7J6N4Z8_PERCH|nr:hypothetical protein FOL47_006971 [Perkinsus chesapeaki]